MSRQLEKDALDFYKWFERHKTDAMDLPNRVTFLTEALDCVMWVLAKAIEDIQILEGRRKPNGIIVANPYLNKVPKDLRVQDPGDV